MECKYFGFQKIRVCEETLDSAYLVVTALDVGDHHVVGGGAKL